MKAICLAAGKGSRLNSEATQIPKVLRKANAKELVKYVLESINFISSSDTTIVVGFEAEKVKTCVGPSYVYALQEEQLGTGHAVMCAKKSFMNLNTHVLICFGDMPLVKSETYKNVISHHKNSGAACTILTVKIDEPTSFGRIIRENGKIVGIVELKDCTDEQKAINELNTGVMVFDSVLLAKYLDELKSENSQHEFYLTDMPRILIENGYLVEGVTTDNAYEGAGVNTEEDLAMVEQILNSQKQ